MQRLWLCLVAGLLGSATGIGAEEGITTVRPADNGAALANPGMGWVFHYYDNVPAHYGSKLAPSDTLDSWPGLSVVYLRIPWSFVEPAEGHYRWSVLDTPAQRWIAKGKQVAFRLSCCESWTRWATPQWVADAGAKGYNFRPGAGVQAEGPFWEPDYDDPVFLAKLDRFLAAMAARYDGNPEVAFVDVGSLGVWGEGHTWASTKRPILPETVKRHIDLHQEHFKHTLLAANDDMGGPDATGDNPVIRYAAERGLTLRDDSILVQAGKRAYFCAGLAQRTPGYFATLTTTAGLHFRATPSRTPCCQPCGPLEQSSWAARSSSPTKLRAEILLCMSDCGLPDGKVHGTTGNGSCRTRARRTAAF